MLRRRLLGPAAVFLLCLAVGAAANGQPEPVPAIPGLPAPTPVQAPAAPAPPPPTPATVDQLIDELTALRNKKAEIERQEQAVIKTLRARLKDQQTRLTALGVGAEPEAIKVPSVPEPAIPDPKK